MGFTAMRDKIFVLKSKKMNIDTAFIQKFYMEITVTIFAVKNGVSRENIEYGRRHIWSPGITIHDYVLLLKIWRVVKLLGKEKSHLVFNKYLDSIDGIPDEMQKIIRKIADIWYTQKIATYALPNIVDNFKEHKMTLTQYIESFIKRTNSYCSPKEL